MNIKDPSHWFTYSLQDSCFYKRDTLTGRFDLTKAQTSQDIVQFLVSLHLVSSKEAKALLKEGAYQSFDQEVLEPFAPEFYKTQEGHTILNTWVPHSLKPEPAPWPSIEKLLKRMTNVENEGPEGYTFLLDFLAYRLRNPQTPSMLLVTFISAPGLGKNTLHKIMARIWGEAHSKCLQSNELDQSFNAELFTNRLLVTADEVIHLDDRRSHLLEIMKQYATADAIRTEAKFRHAKAIKNQITWFIMTNHQNAIKLQPDDRRFVVYENMEANGGTSGWSEWVRTTFWNPANTTEFSDTLKREILGFWHDLTQRNLEQFELKPPENKARARLKSLSEDTVHQFLEAYTELGIKEMVDIYARSDLGSTLSTRIDDTKGIIAANLARRMYFNFCKDIGSPAYRSRMFETKLLQSGVQKYAHQFNNSRGRPHNVYDFSGVVNVGEGGS